MSIARALSNAMTGLGATARGTELVSANLANAMTPGYARRELAVSSQGMAGNMGGVRIDGVVRAVNAGLVSESRLANSQQSESATKAAFLSRMEGVIGLPAEGHALTTALSNFQVALSSASARPEDDLRLAKVLDTATTLTGRLSTASKAVQDARTEAERAIATDIGVLNNSLERVAYLNRRIAAISAEGHDASSLHDERQQVINRISAIVPIQEVSREAGKVALFTRSGAVLLDGVTPTRFGFQPIGQVQSGHVPGAPLNYIVYDDDELSSGQMRLLSGGSLAGHFAIRDELAPRLQQDLDVLAFELQARLGSPQVDGTLNAGDAGLFTDAGQAADPAQLAGLAGRISVNPLADPDRGGQLWRLRSGLNAVDGNPVSDPTVLNAAVRALESALPVAAPVAPNGNASLSIRFGHFAGAVSSDRVGAEADLAMRSARLSTISSRIMADGVDSDAEMQKLLQYEQAYAANARIIKAIDEMINQLLRI